MRIFHYLGLSNKPNPSGQGNRRTFLKNLGIKNESIVKVFDIVNDEQWKVYVNSVSQYKEKGWRTSDLTRGFAQLVQSNPTDEQWKVYVNSVSQYKEKGWRTSDLTSGFAQLVQSKATKEQLEVYVNSLSQYKEKGWAIDYLNSIIQQTAKDGLLLKLLGNHLEGLKKGYFNSSESAKESLTNILNICSARTLLNSDERPDISTPDPSPYIQGSKEEKEMFSQTLSVYKREIDSFLGFEALTYEARKPPGESPLLARFGNSIGNVSYINSSSNRTNGLFPGNGLKISNILLPDEIKSFLKTTAPWAKDEVDDLEKTEIYYFRGMVIINVDSDKHKVRGPDGNYENYSYVFYNDHLHNYGNDVAFLARTKIIKEKLQGLEVPIDNYVGFQKDKKDAVKAGLEPQEIKESEGTVNLCWISNLSGGLCNGRKVGSRPYHAWERKKELQGETKDPVGHIHKSHITGSYINSLTPELEREMKPFREAHEDTYRVTNAYQNIYDLIKLLESLYHKGIIGQEVENLPGVIENFEDNQKEYVYENNDELNQEGREEENKAAWTRNPGARRMLVEVYRWHSGRNDGGKEKPKEEFPVLLDTGTFDYSNKPDNYRFKIDTYDRSIEVKKKDGTIIRGELCEKLGKRELKIWRKILRITGSDNGRDIRFYDRRVLGKEENNKGELKQ